MNPAAQPELPKPQATESLDERTAMLFEELELAIRWERPSILIAVYESDITRAEVEAALARRLSGLGQRVAPFQASEKEYDIPLILSQKPEREQTVFYVSGLRWGGGKGGARAYQALNLHREYFVDPPIRAVLWLTKAEAGFLPRRAPDFWAFRHRVIEFVDLPAHKGEALSRTELTWGDWDTEASPEGADGKISLREELLASLPEGEESQAARSDLLYPLAILYWAKGDYERSTSLLKQGLDIALRLQDRRMSSCFWIGLGILETSAGHANKALSAFKKAAKLNPGDTVPWSNVAITYHQMGQYDESIRACLQAIALNPKQALPWTILGNLYHDQGRFEDAREAFRTATRLEPGDARPWSRLGMAYRDLDRPREAIRALHKAVRLAPGDSDAWKKLGELYWDLGRYREAVHAYQRVLALDPQDETSRASLEACSQKQGKKQGSSAR